MIDRSLNYGRHHIRRFLEEAKPYNVVLDMGAGYGQDLMAAREVVPSTELWGLEVLPEYREALEKQGIKTVAFNLEREAFPFEDESIDIIMGNQIIEHVKEVFWIFHQISRTLKVGGRMIIGVPNLASLHNRILLMAGKQPTAITTASAHVRGWTKPDVLRFLESCYPGGYQLRGFGGSNFYPFPSFVAKPLAAVLPNMAWGIFFSLEKVKPYNGEFLDFVKTRALETPFYTGPD